MRRICSLALILVALLTQACVNYQYRGEISAHDSFGEPRQAILYWSKTKAWLARPKAGHAIVLTECGVPIRYDQRPEQIVFRGTPGEDRIPGQPPPIVDNLECGHFVEQISLVEVEAGDIQLTVLCEAVSNEFSVTATGRARSYLQVRAEPYVFPVTRRKSTSLFGKIPDAPSPPVCRAQEAD